MRRCMRPDNRTAKRILALVLCLALCLGAGSCAAPSRKEARTVKIALLSGQASADASAAFAGEFEAAMDALSGDDIVYDVTVLLSGASPSKQLAQMDMCCLQDYDIIVVEPADPAKGDDYLARAIRYVPLEEAEEEEGAEEGTDLYAVYEKLQENASYSDERLNAEGREYPAGVYAPVTVPENVPVVFAGLIPVITPKEEPVPEEQGEPEDDEYDDEEEESPQEPSEPGEPEEPESVWCVAGYDHLAAAQALALDIIEKGLLRDVNGDGKTAYAFVCTDASNPVNQAVMNVVKTSLSGEYPDAVQAFTCFMALSEDAFVERLIYYMTGSTAADLIIALDDRAIDYTDTFSLVCGYEEDEEKRHDVTFDLGDELILAGIGHSDYSRVMFEEGKLSSLVVFEPWSLAEEAARRCAAIASGEETDDICLEWVRVEISSDEEEKK